LIVTQEVKIQTDPPPSRHTVFSTRILALRDSGSLCSPGRPPPGAKAHATNEVGRGPGAFPLCAGPPVHSPAVIPRPPSRKPGRESGVPNACRFCVRWGGGSATLEKRPCPILPSAGVPDTRRCCARWGREAEESLLQFCQPSVVIPSESARRNVFRRADEGEGSAFAFSGAPPFVFKGGSVRCSSGRPPKRAFCAKAETLGFLLLLTRARQHSRARAASTCWHARNELESA